MNMTNPVLIVEDDRILADQIKKHLSSWNIPSFIPGDFSSIDQLVSELSPSLILMDITLPLYDGFYWCSKIREFSQVPILFISSRTDEGSTIHAC